MAWQDRFRALGEDLVSGRIGTDEYRARSEEILAEVDRQAAEATQPTARSTTQPTQSPLVRIPASAAWEAPTGEMTQIVGTRDETALVNDPVDESGKAPVSISDKLETNGDD
ncbi:MAG: hypothetical protein ACRDSK_03795 [Actinophytocola sp.]|uniref:hypothetical protein n=1 Tax=Actinophytocola sp. TaxID=1872138 RepID=UPI003D6B4A21